MAGVECSGKGLNLELRFVARLSGIDWEMANMLKYVVIIFDGARLKKILSLRFRSWLGVLLVG